MQIRKRTIKITLLSMLYVSFNLVLCSLAQANSCKKLFQLQTMQTHQEVTQDLFSGNVIKSAPFSANGNQTEMFTGRIRNPINGRERDVLFKPRIYGDNDGYGRTPGEYLAYRMNILLGMDYVPPVAYRKNIDFDFKHFSEGAILYRVSDAHNLKDVPRGEWGEDPTLFLSDTRILDVLIQNPDRHDKNFLRGKHWVDGSYRPMLIDHAAAMRPQSDTRLDQPGSLDPGSIQVVRKTTWDNLFKLNFEILKREIGEFYSDAEIRQILSRRDQISEYFHKLASESGWDKVVL